MGMSRVRRSRRNGRDVRLLSAGVLESCEPRHGKEIHAGKAVRSVPEIDEASSKRAADVSLLWSCLGRAEVGQPGASHGQAEGDAGPVLRRCTRTVRGRCETAK